MFIKKLQGFDYVYKNSQIIKKGLRTTTYGELYNGDKIVIDNNYRDGKIFSKRYVIWNNNMQKIFNKVKNKDGKFDILW